MARVRIREAVRRRQPGEVFTFVRRFPAFVKLFARLLRDSRVSALPKLVLFGAAAYVVSPADFLTDWLPLLGQVDDLALLAMACRVFLQLCPRPVVEEHAAAIDGRGNWLSG